MYFLSANFVVTATFSIELEKFLELEEYVKLVRAAIEEWSEDYPQYLYITYALAGTGARTGEICALELSDLNADKKSLKIDKTLVREDGVYLSKILQKQEKREKEKLD